MQAPASSKSRSVGPSGQDLLYAALPHRRYGLIHQFQCSLTQNASVVHVPPTIARSASCRTADQGPSSCRVRPVDPTPGTTHPSAWRDPPATSSQGVNSSVAGTPLGGEREPGHNETPEGTTRPGLRVHQCKHRLLRNLGRLAPPGKTYSTSADRSRDTYLSTSFTVRCRFCRSCPRTAHNRNGAAPGGSHPTGPGRRRGLAAAA